MESRDYIEKELSKLSKILAHLIGLRKENKLTEAIVYINECCLNHYDFNSDVLISDRTMDVGYHLYDQKKLTLPQMEVVTELILQKAEIFAELDSKHISEIYYNAAIKLFDFIESHNKTYSMERQKKLSEFKQKLNNFNHTFSNN